MGPASVSFPALGTTATLLVSTECALNRAESILRAELAAIEAACSRFRADSELSRVNATAGTGVTVSALLAEALRVAWRAAELTGGVVDPTVGRAVMELGYDRSFSAIREESAAPLSPPRRAPGWRTVEWDPDNRRLRLPAGVALDLGATAKALAADRAARAVAAQTSGGALVNLGGDLATAGDPPPGGWVVGLADDHAAPSASTVVAITSGAIATSGTSVRRWRRAGEVVHHIIDPRTGANSVPCWRTVTVAAGSCTDANTASTAAVVLAEAAPDWLRRAQLPARLVHLDGTVLVTGGWFPGHHGPGASR